MGNVKWMRRLAAVALVVAVLVGAGWEYRQLRGSDSPVNNTGTGLTLFYGDKGIPLPAIKGRTLDGAQLNLDSLRGHVLVLNVWGSWCAPCRAEAPDLAKISKETAPRGVRFVGIDVRDNVAAAKAFERNYGITYPSFDDQQGLVLAQFTGIIPVGAVPSTIVIDRTGTIRARIIGRLDPSTLRGLITDAEAGR